MYSDLVATHTLYLKFPGHPVVCPCLRPHMMLHTAAVAVVAVVVAIVAVNDYDFLGLYVVLIFL